MMNEVATLPAEETLGEYVERARKWLDSVVPQFGTEAQQGLDVDQWVSLARRYQAAKADAGFAAITLPREVGGGGGSEIHKILFGTEEFKRGMPWHFYGVSLGMPVPMMLRYGSPEIVQKLVPPSIRGELLWCQLFSEPSAGSDLAAVRTRAERDGEGWRISGQKLWTSWAQYADYAIAVVRTDPTVPKHAGLTFFWLDMKSPGIEVRTVRKLAGESEINEVFFDNVYVPDSQRMGAVGEGFKVAIETLMIERYSVGDDAMGGPTLERFAAAAAEAKINGKSALDDGQVRRVLADAMVERQGLRSIHRRALAAIGEGKEPGPEGSIRKLRLARRRQIMGELALDLLGAAGVVLDDDASKTNDPAWSWIEVPGGRIAGGTDEILRNTIAEKILSLPQDYRPDKKVPFNQIG
jgi:alkylation response protein AidB-like acyl-CoA dehydrogenase